MARVDGPLMSMGASGSVAGTIVFSKWKGRPYVRQLVRPANPKTDNQISVRAMMQFLSQNWAAISAPNKATWLPFAEAGAMSNFNAYTKENLLRWRNFQAPTQLYPATAANLIGVTPVLTATGGVRQATITTSLTTLNQNWGVLIFRSTTTGFTPGFGNLVHVNLQTAITATTWQDTPLAAGTYYYNAILFATGGAQGAAVGQQTAIVT